MRRRRRREEKDWDGKTNPRFPVPGEKEEEKKEEETRKFFEIFIFKIHSFQEKKELSQIANFLIPISFQSATH